MNRPANGVSGRSRTTTTSLAGALQSRSPAEGTTRGPSMTIPFRIHHRVAPVMLAAATALGVQAVQAATWVYVANADSQDVSVLELDRAAGTLKTVDTTALGGAAMPMAVSPDKRVLYVALRSQPFRVVSLAIDPASGKLRKLGEAPLADSMANIDTDATGRWLFAASYPGHKITVNSIGKDGVVGLSLIHI